jgi:hypothetical protein
MKIVIMTYKDAPQERLDNANKLAKELQNDCADCEVFVGGTCYIDNMYQVFKKANNNGDDLLMFEDDVYLCKDFLKKVKKAINEYPNRVINFFNLHYDITEPVNMSFTQWTECQCYYVPRRVLPKLTLLYKAFIKLAPKTYKCNIADYTLYYPSLVQQFDFNSVIFNGRIDEQSKTFDSL